MNDFVSPFPCGSVLSRAQANEVFRLIEKSGIDHKEFGWQATGNDIYGTSDGMRHHGTGAEFIFWGEMSPTIVESKLRSRKVSLFGIGWDAAAEEFGTWLNLLRQELVEPDLWAESLQFTALATSVLGLEDNRTFSREEFNRIQSSVESLRTTFSSALGDASDNLAQVMATLDYMKESASRLGKKDWINAFIGSVFGVLLGAGLPPEVLHALLQRVADSFSWLLVTAPLLPK
jgi:hypothetical protein